MTNHLLFYCKCLCTMQQERGSACAVAITRMTRWRTLVRATGLAQGFFVTRRRGGGSTGALGHLATLLGEGEQQWAHLEVQKVSPCWLPREAQGCQHGQRANADQAWHAQSHDGPPAFNGTPKAKKQSPATMRARCTRQRRHTIETGKHTRTSQCTHHAPRLTTQQQGRKKKIKEQTKKREAHAHSRGPAPLSSTRE